MFRSQLFDHLQGVVLRASAITTFSACLCRFIWYVAVCCLGVCVPDVPVCVIIQQRGTNMLASFYLVWGCMLSMCVRA